MIMVAVKTFQMLFGQFPCLPVYEKFNNKNTVFRYVQIKRPAVVPGMNFKLSMWNHFCMAVGMSGITLNTESLHANLEGTCAHSLLFPDIAFLQILIICPCEWKSQQETRKHAENKNTAAKKNGRPALHLEKTGSLAGLSKFSDRAIFLYQNHQRQGVLAHDERIASSESSDTEP